MGKSAFRDYDFLLNFSMVFENHFFTALSRLARDLRILSPGALVWKAADPSHWGETPRSLGEHRHPWCLRVKRDQSRLERCRAVDNVTEMGLPEGPRPCLRTCPFGVTDLLVPVYSARTYVGLLEIGGWRGTGGHPSLPPFPGRPKAMALGRLARAALDPLLPKLEIAYTRLEASRDPLMAQAVVYIGDHLDAGLRSVQVATAADLSVSRFLHRFKAATGETFHGHVERRLMAEACRRLLSSPIPAEKIGDELGYRNASAFSATFRRSLGLPPGLWRERNRTTQQP